MKTTINNDLRVYMVTDSMMHHWFCNIEDLNAVVINNNLRPGYFKIFHCWNNKFVRVTKKDLLLFFEGANLKQKFIY